MDKFKKFVNNLIEVIRRPELLTLPSSLAYYFVLSCVPIISIIILIATSFNLSISYITEFISKNFSEDLMNLIMPMFTENSFSLPFLVYLVVAFFIASNGSDAIIVASNTVFNIKSNNVIKRRLKAFLITILIFMLFTFLLIVPVFGRQLINFFMTIGFDNIVVDSIDLLYPILYVPLTVLVIYYFIKLIYVIAPDEKIKSKYVIKGTLFTTIFWFLATFIYSFFIRNIAHYNVYYAGLSTIVVLMIWFYILAFVFVIGLGLNYTNVEEQIEKTNTIKLKELEEKVKANKVKQK